MSAPKRSSTTPYFRSHKEVDCQSSDDAAECNLSTHDLSRRSTFCCNTASSKHCFLSTHNLSRRSTTVYFRKFLHLPSFNSRPHTEVDTGEGKMKNGASLSTHDLTRRSTKDRISKAERERTFQLTPHTEVDAAILAGEDRRKPFNSRPHTEVDGKASKLLDRLDLSTHDLTRRSTGK